MKKAVWLLSALSLATVYSSTASANDGRIFLQSGEKQLEISYEPPPSVSDEELDEAISRLVGNQTGSSTSYGPFPETFPSSAPSYEPVITSTNAPAPARLGSQAAPSIAAQVAARAAHSRSQGRCAMYVRKALQQAGYRFTPQASAYMYAHGTLKSAGFVQISASNYKPQVGDVVVFNRTARNPHGHIQIYDGKQWVSDFRQPKFSPYSQHNGYSVWRDARYTNTNGTYLAMNEQ